MSDPTRIHLTTGVVYIAGIECPVESITVSGGEGIIPTMTLTLPASTELVRFGEEDRVPVVAFYLDQWHSETGDPKDIIPQMRLLFDGEIIDWGYSETPGGDYINFNCVANVAMLNNMFANFLIGGDTASQAIALDNFSSTQGITTGDFRTFPLILLNKGLFAGKQKAINRPFDFIANMLLAIKIGGYPNSKAIGDNGLFTDAFKSDITKNENAKRIDPNAYAAYLLGIVPSVMGFFVTYNQRVKFDRRWIATPLERFTEADNLTDINNPARFRQSVDTRFAAIRADIFLKAASRALESLFGQGDSFMKILNTYYAINSFQIMMLPTAPFVLVERDTIENYGTGGQNSYIPSSTVTASASTQFRLGNNISKPISYFALPPECNIIFPGLISTISFQENYAAQATRTIAGNPYLDYAQRQGQLSESDRVTQAATVNGWPFDLGQLVRANSGKQFSAMLLYPEEYFKGPVVNSITIPSWYTALREATGQQDKNAAVTKLQKTEQAANGEKDLDIAAITKQLDGGITGLSGEQIQAYAEAANRAGTLTQDQKLELFAKYLRMSHYENRFSYRNGQAEGPFNPYILPCHPFVYLSVKAAAMHIMGYVTTFQHRLSATTGANTSFSYSYGRTLKEVYEIAIGTHYDQMLKNGKGFDVFHSSAPLEPTVVVAKTLQSDDAAADYYQQTFYQNADGTISSGTNKKEYVFRYATYFDTSKDPFGHGQLPTATTPDVKPSKDDPGVYEVVLNLKRENLDNLTDYTKGMQRVSRPICTLDQYIRFINEGSSGLATQNLAEQGKAGVIPAAVYGVPVPTQIRVYSASGQPAAQNRLEHYIVPTSATPTSDGKGKPQDLRRDWVARIKSYRAKMYGRVVQ